MTHVVSIILLFILYCFYFYRVLSSYCFYKENSNSFILILITSIPILSKYKTPKLLFFDKDKVGNVNE